MTFEGNRHVKEGSDTGYLSPLPCHDKEALGAEDQGSLYEKPSYLHLSCTRVGQEFTRKGKTSGGKIPKKKKGNKRLLTKRQSRLIRQWQDEKNKRWLYTNNSQNNDWHQHNVT